MDGPFIRTLLADPALGFSLLEHLPIALNVTDAQGYLVYGNPKFLEGTLDSARREAKGHYNILEEPMLESWGLKDHIAKAFAGETVVTKHLELPNREMVDSRYSKEFANITLYQDVYSYPIHDLEGNLRYIVTLFVPVSRYCEREDIKKGREYIGAHWLEPFNVEAAAATACLSVSRFNSCFKDQLGTTPHQYYLHLRLEALKGKLVDPNLSIADCFTSCGMDYNHHYVSWFKSEMEMTPMQFRKLYRKEA